MIGERQEEFIYKNKSRKIVQGYFYIDGVRYKRKVCTFDEAGLDDSGEPLNKTKTAVKRYRSTIRKLYSEAEQQLIEQVKKPKITERDMKFLFSEWVEASHATKHQETTKIYERLQKQYLKIVGNHSLPLQLRHLDRFIAGLSELGLKPVTINLKLDKLKACLNWATERQLITEMPKIKKLPEVRKIQSILSKEEVNALIQRIKSLIQNTSRQRDKEYYESHLRFLLILIGTGMRRSEVFYLRWEDVDFDSKTIKVQSHGSFQVKEKKDKVILMPRSLSDFLKEEHERSKHSTLFSHLYHKPSAVTTAFRRHLTELGLNGKMKTIHGFRASFATNLYREGVDSHTIKTMLGHSNISVTEIYLTDPQHAQKEAVKKLEESLNF